MARVRPRSLVVFLGSIGLLGLAAGCGDEKLGGSCDFRPQGGDRCFEYSASQLESGKSVCNEGRVWSDGKPCDKAGSIGGCATTSGITKWLYPGEKFKTRADAGVECTTWLDAK